MGDSIRKCPLCCDQMFTSKNELIKHLNEVSGNLLCPFCNNSGYSVAQLIEHLTLDNCQANIAVSDTNNKLVFQIGPDTGIDQVRTYKSALEYEDFSVTKKEVSDIDPKPVDDPFGNIDSPGIEEDDSEINKMYVELISKQLTKPCLQTQEIRLVKDRYVIVSNEAAEASLGSRVVTKQNNDGTISLTTVKDMKLESDTLITQEKDADDNQEEVYSCNSCGVSFTSVIEHIQNYHNDQDVVVEDPLCASLPMEMNDEDSADKQTPRRMITETGDIVETPAELTNISLEPRNENASQELSDALKAPVTDKNVVVYTRPCVEIDNGNIVKNGAETVKKGPYHKVVMKQMQTTGGDTVKVFNCTTCNLYVSTLEDFKGHPCKPEPPSAETVSEESDPTVKQITPDKDGRKRAYVQIEKFCDSIIKDVNEPDENKGPYHKVVMKDLQTTSGETIKVYNCMTCNLYVSSLEDFKSQPCKLVKYSCPNCPVSYKNYKSLSAHMKIHKPPKQETGTTPTQALFECEVCATIFPTNKSLKLHKRMHDPIKARPIEPPSDTSTDKFLCNICGKHIPTYYREVHQNSHRNVDMFNCDICNKKFQSSEYLEMHMTVHTTDKAPVSKQDKSLPYICLYCGRRFARPHEKVKHERIHTGERPHSCEICGKSFRVSYCLTLHMRTHTGARPYACQHCGKRFKAHSVYNHHLLTHSEVRAYKCPYCPKAFKTSVQLAGHKNSHTKPFSCQHCNRPFASLYAVRVHTETHLRHNNLRYSCTQCGASYARSFALKDHMKQHEQQQDLNLVERVSKTDDWVKPPEGNEALEVEVASPPPGAEEVSLM